MRTAIRRIDPTIVFTPKSQHQPCQIDGPEVKTLLRGQHGQLIRFRSTARDLTPISRANILDVRYVSRWLPSTFP